MDSHAIARALSTSPLWDSSPATLVVGPPEDPFLAAIGCFDQAVRARLEVLSWELDRAVIRYVDYRRAEEDCVRLAALMVERWDRAELKRFRYVAIPRGGLLVLGLLAYALDLPPAALARPSDGNGPLVVVDDCALSGARFRAALGRHPGEPVIFAHLCSPPGLRAAIESGEPRVLACVAAQDLRDYAPEMFGDGYETWLEQWKSRSPQAYWVGKTEHLCFSWSEPEHAVWNPATGAVEKGWRLLPEEVCLKNRAAAGDRRVPVQIQPPGMGPLGPAPHVVFATLAGRLVVGNTQTGEAVVLDGVAADMWTAVIAKGSAAAAASALSDSYDITPAGLRSDLDRFVADAAGRGLLALRSPDLAEPG